MCNRQAHLFWDLYQGSNGLQRMTKDLKAEYTRERRGKQLERRQWSENAPNHHQCTYTEAREGVRCYVSIYGCSHGSESNAHKMSVHRNKRSTLCTCRTWSVHTETTLLRLCNVKEERGGRERSKTVLEDRCRSWSEQVMTVSPIHHFDSSTRFQQGIMDCLQHCVCVCVCAGVKWSHPRAHWAGSSPH